MRSSFAAAILSSMVTLVSSPALAEDTSPAQLTLRGGYAKFYAFNFGTAGLEAAVRTVAGLHVVAGAELYAVNVVLPPDQQLETGDFSRWNTLLPFNVGAVYKLDIGPMLRPYGGADLIFAQYYRSVDAADWAAGARLRLGADVMLHKHIGLNANVSVGGWSGQRWDDLKAGLPNGGWLPQISAGVVAAL
ncbi:MAG: hypothetical protein KTR31_17390 [Myxococcales bacterium]|nr:hypothetical protein [Myxococcales bacterium]